MMARPRSTTPAAYMARARKEYRQAKDALRVARLFRDRGEPEQARQWARIARLTNRLARHQVWMAGHARRTARLLADPFARRAVQSAGLLPTPEAGR